MVQIMAQYETGDNTESKNNLSIWGLNDIGSTLDEPELK